MKNLKFLAVLIVSALVLVSCEKQHPNKDGVEIGVNGAKVTWAPGPSTPTSALGVVPEIIDGENNGGNRTCMEVFDELGQGGECGVDFLCGEKVDYDEGSGWASSFPAGLDVQLDGIHISFSIPGCLEINGEFWQVGAVIVKGTNAANIYWYPGGATADQGLAAPGDKHMVSNLTFCLIPCEYEEPDKIIGLKVKDDSEGTYAFTNTGGWYIQCVPFVDQGAYPIYRDHYETDPIGMLYIGNVTGTSALDVTIDIDDDVLDFAIDEVYIHIGSVGSCYQDYGSFPYQDETLDQEVLVIIDGDDL